MPLRSTKPQRRTTRRAIEACPGCSASITDRSGGIRRLQRSALTLTVSIPLLQSATSETTSKLPYSMVVFHRLPRLRRTKVPPRGLLRCHLPLRSVPPLHRLLRPRASSATFTLSSITEHPQIHQAPPTDLPLGEGLQVPLKNRYRVIRPLLPMSLRLQPRALCLMYLKRSVQ